MKILGLDLGVGSVGWSLIELDENKIPAKILGLGSRIVSLTPDESNNFSKGSGESVCSQRTAMRTARKCLDRYQMRRAQLTEKLGALGMIDPENRMLTLSPMELWQLRADAATDGHQISRVELGRVLLHLNQKRGYRHSKEDNSDGKQTEYVANVNARFKTLHEEGLTAGQYFAKELRNSEQTTPAVKKFYTYRIKERVLPRKAYEEEFDKIMQVQSGFYPELLDSNTVADLKNIIFYQRPLKSCKHLVSVCDFMKRYYSNDRGTQVVAGPKVASRTSPLAQVERLYEAINNLRLVNYSNRRRKNKYEDQPSLFGESETLPKDVRLLQFEYKFTDEERRKIFDHLNTHEKLTGNDLFKILGLKKADGFKLDQSLNKGLQGNLTRVKLAKALEGVLDKETIDQLLKFDLSTVETGKYNQETGEVIREIDPKYIEQPLYRLWHIIYSISNKEELAKAIAKNYGEQYPAMTEPEVIDRLFAIDFVKDGFANKSAKFMRMLLPLLMEGKMYSEAATEVNVNHSDSLSTEQNMARELKPKLENLRKGELRQPIVEKILNQMINVVNALIDKFGPIDEIRVELARSLKQSKDERAEATKAISKNEKLNADIANIILEHGLRASRRNIQKYKLFKETGETCIYCGQPVTMSEFLGGHGAEVEHIIPRSLLFDDSLANKACSCRKCNQEKGQRTAYDYMSSRSEDDLRRYEERVAKLYEEKSISRKKRDYLLTTADKIPSDFLERDLRQTQYISRKAREILMNVCRNVYASSGSVTDFFRHAWGYDNVLHNINIDRFRLADLVEEVEFEHEGQIHKEMRIQGWSKRMDHRHHAIDALVVALTRQGYVQRLNNLNQERDQMYSELEKQSGEHQEKFHLLEKWAETRPHFPVSQVEAQADIIAVSFKAGKKLTTPARRMIRRNNRMVVAQKGLSVPRGSLHQETIYGRIKTLDKGKTLKYAFQNIDLIVDPKIREGLKMLLDEAGGDVSKAQKLFKKKPVTAGKDNVPIATVDCYRQEFVGRYDVASLEPKDFPYIIDEAVRNVIKERYDSIPEGKQKKKQFQQSLEENPVTVGKDVLIPVRKVKCFTGLKEDKVVAVRKDTSGRPLAFAKTGNNHHVAFYKDADGKVQTMVTSFWVGVKRHALGLPAIVEEPVAAWDILANLPDSMDVQEVAASLPQPDWTFLSSMRMNEMFVLGMSDDEFSDAVSSGDLKALTNHLYRVQKLSLNDYMFRLHTHTTVDAEQCDKEMARYQNAKSYKALEALNPKKVRVNCIGEISFDI